MGAGMHVGRVGGLAVALGIGAAVFVGAGAASADEGAASETGSAARSSETSAAERPGKPEKPAKSAKDESSDEERAPAKVKRAPTPTESDAPDDSDEEASDEEDSEEPTDTVELSAPDPDDPAENPAEPEEPEEPTAPTLASLLTSVVSATREVTDEAPSVTAESDAPQYPIPTGVKVEEYTPPLEFLQTIPVLGPTIVTPVVSLIHLVPLVGDIVHPLVGFPIDHFAPPGTPRARTFVVTSFDGTEIFVNFMPAKGLQAGDEAPTVLNGPGLGLLGSTALDLRGDSLLPYDVIGVGRLREEGYNVVTWDPRGEWHSGGRMQLQSPDYEGRDVSHIISYLATLDEVALDGVNDPKIGMVGASYGGGIQLATAAVDHRVDAIVPTIAWNDLGTVLFADDSVRSGWGTLLSAVLVLTGSRPNERILPAAVVGIITGYVAQDDLDLLENRGYADQIGDITTPTLLIQGTVDTLFTLGQAHENALDLIDAGTTTKVLWYNGGHGTSLTDFNDGDVVIERTIDWLDKYVKGEDIDTGDQFEWVDQNGEWYSADTYPLESTTPVEASDTPGRTLPFIPFLGGSVPNPLILTRQPIQALLGLPSATSALNAANLSVPDVSGETHIVGAPELTLTYSGAGNATHVYAQIVDDDTGLVLGNQVTAIPVTLDGGTHTVTVSLEQVAHTLQPGQSVTVQVVTSAVNFLNFYSWGAVTVEEMSVTLPTVEAVASGRAPVAGAPAMHAV